MTYLFGIIGFVGGFGVGLFVINIFLRGRPKRELMRNKSIHWTYGLAVWIIAGLGAWAGVWMYQQHLLTP